MKIIITLIIALCSYQLQAACKCNCNPADTNICASSIDLDHPCNGVCPSQAGFIQMRTACPIVPLVNPITGVTGWGTFCVD